ncbi:hypothetical protein E2562_004508 [Oryza meyeriana var. granulata]|uniref:Uncharacterized protein n=1 Tax=Oryza meyeriana var. granulata TaxID=110450 RepID=A0A6G1F396_9ORYZ|nr:hypothetical protein E2562_004508 [Oryza meyeriana var. granulata]
MTGWKKEWLAGGAREDSAGLQAAGAEIQAPPVPVPVQLRQWWMRVWMTRARSQHSAPVTVQV